MRAHMPPACRAELMQRHEASGPLLVHTEIEQRAPLVGMLHEEEDIFHLEVRVHRLYTLCMVAVQVLAERVVLVVLDRKGIVRRCTILADQEGMVVVAAHLIHEVAEVGTRVVDLDMIMVQILAPPEEVVVDTRSPVVCCTMVAGRIQGICQELAMLLVLVSEEICQHYREAAVTEEYILHGKFSNLARMHGYILAFLSHETPHFSFTFPAFFI